MTRRMRYLVAVGVWVGIGVVVPAASQPVRDKVLTENPYRTPGGSCIYGAKGQLVYAPPGATCSNKVAESPPEGAASETLTPEMAQRMRALFATHPHIADEIVAVRRAVEAGDRTEALKKLDHVLGEVSANKAAAEDVLDEALRSQAPRR